MGLVEQKKKLFNDLLELEAQEQRSYKPNNPKQIKTSNVLDNVLKAGFNFAPKIFKPSSLLGANRHMAALLSNNIILPPEGTGIMAINFMSLKQTGPFYGSNHARVPSFVNEDNKLFKFAIEAEKHKQDGKNKFSLVEDSNCSEESIILPINSCGVARKDLQPKNFLVTAERMVSIIIASALIAKQFNEDSKRYNLKNNNCNTACTVVAESLIEAKIIQPPADWELVQVAFNVATGAVGLGSGDPLRLSEEAYQEMAEHSKTEPENLQETLKGYISCINFPMVSEGSKFIPASIATALWLHTNWQGHTEIRDLIGAQFTDAMRESLR